MTSMAKLLKNNDRTINAVPVPQVVGCRLQIVARQRLGDSLRIRNLKIDYFSSSRRALTNDLQHGTAGSAHCEAPALLGQNPKFQKLAQDVLSCAHTEFLIGTHVV